MTKDKRNRRGVEYWYGDMSVSVDTRDGKVRTTVHDPFGVRDPDLRRRVLRAALAALRRKARESAHGR